MVEVALSIRLEAMPGKEKEVEQFLLAGLLWCAMNRGRLPGLACASAPRHSGSSMHFPTMRDGRRTFRAR